MANTPQISDGQANAGNAGEVDSALLDAELFVKYKAPERAIKRLKTALERNPRSIPLRERLREVAAAHKHPDKRRVRARPRSLYTNAMILTALTIVCLKPNSSTPNKCRQSPRSPFATPGGRCAAASATRQSESQASISYLAGDLSAVSLFDAIQVIENARLTGALILTSDAQTAAYFLMREELWTRTAGSKGARCLRHVVEITTAFEFQISAAEFPVAILASSNTNLILDTLTQLDKAKA